LLSKRKYSVHKSSAPADFSFLKKKEVKETCESLGAPPESVFLLPLRSPHLPQVMPRKLGKPFTSMLSSDPIHHASPSSLK